MFLGHSGASLVDLGIYFYNASYNVPHRDWAYESICLLPPLAFEGMECPTPDPFTIDEFRMQMNRDIQASMKFTFGLKYVGVNQFMPSSVFVYFFKMITIHRTKTMWVCKEITQQLLDNLLYPSWDVREGVSKGDFYTCEISKEKMVTRYHVAHASFSMQYSYKRCKNNHGTWDSFGL